MSSGTNAYGEGREPIPALDQPTVIFMINKSLPKETRSAQQVYDATRRSWVIGERARERAVYALGVSHGVVRGAFRIDRWYLEGGNRWRFEGVAAPELAHVVDTSIERIKARQGNSSPVRYFLDGIAAPTDPS